MKDGASSTWPIKPLGELCRIELGSTPARNNALLWDEKRQTNNVWLSIADMPQTLHGVAGDSKEYVADLATHRMRLIPKGALLVSFKLTLGRLAYAGRDLFSNEAIASLLEIDEKVISKSFLYWALTAFDWDKAAEGDQKIKGKTLNKKKLKLIPIPLPPLEEQQRIVAVLDEAFEGLARAHAHAEANLQNARELFESMLSAMLTAQSAGWETHPLADCFRLKSGENLTAKDMVPGPYPVYGGNGIAGTHDNSNLSGNNVIVGRVGALCGNARFIDHDIWLTDNAFKVVGYKFDFDHSFLTYLLNFKNLRKLARQAAQPVISNSSLAALELTFPLSVDVQADLASKLACAESELESVQKMYERKVEDLDDLRQSLLQKAFAGELT